MEPPLLTTSPPGPAESDDRERTPSERAEARARRRAQRTGEGAGGDRAPARRERTPRAERRRPSRGTVAAWMIAAGAAALALALFLPWSHQFSASLLARYGASPLLRGVPRDPTAWQLYTSIDVLLAALAAALVLVALVGRGGARLIAASGVALALAFTIHALSTPPTNGADIVDPVHANRYLPNSPRSGPGEVLALVGLGIAAAGLALSYRAE